MDFDQLDGFGGTIRGWLPELVIRGMTDPVVQVADAKSGDIVYTLRIPGTRFSAPVFGDGPFNVSIGEPGTDRWTVVEDLTPGPEAPARVVEVAWPGQPSERQPASR